MAVRQPASEEALFRQRLLTKNISNYCFIWVWNLVFVLDYLRAFGKEVLRKTSDLPPTSNRKTKNTNFTQKKHSCYLQQTYHQGEQMVRTNKLLMMKYEQIKISYKFLVWRPERKNSLDRRMATWDDHSKIIKMFSIKTRCEDAYRLLYLRKARKVSRHVK